MKILTLSIDRKLADTRSAAAERVRWYAGIVDQYDVVYPTEAGSKLSIFFNIARKAKDLLSKTHYDVISVQDPFYIGLIGSRMAERFGCALEVQVHGFEKMNYFRRRIARRVLDRADSVRVVSKRLKDQLVKEFSVPEDKITIAPIYVDISGLIKSAQLESSPQSKEITQSALDSFIFLTVSRLVPVKRVSLQLRAFSHIAGEFPRAVLHIVGDGPSRQALEREAGAYKIADRVKFLGWSEDTDTFYSKADAFLLTSRSEGWGMAVVEAAGHALPIIMTDVGCAGELIVNDVSGLIVGASADHASVSNKTEDSTDLVGILVLAMKRLITDPALHARLGAEAQKAVQKLPSKDQTLALYKQSWEKAVQKAAQKKGQNIAEKKASSGANANRI